MTTPFSVWNVACTSQCRPHDDTLHEHAGTLSLDGVECSTLVSCVDGDIRVGHFWADSAPGMAEFEHVTLFLFVLMWPCC
jgi:hypothetical protein